MPKTINATEAVRTFSDILNSVKYRHETYTIVRGGKPAAALVPVEVSPVRKTLRELTTIVNELPRLGKDADGFMRDIEDAIRTQPHLPEQAAWE
jgi:prevent-host-death family protein